MRLSPLPLLDFLRHRPRRHQASLASRRLQADTLPHQRGSLTVSSLHRQASSRGTGSHRSLKLRDPASLFPASPEHIYLQHPREHRRQQYRPMRSCGISKRRAPHLCLLRSNVGVLLQAVPALGEAEVMSIRHLLLMARVMVRHKMLHPRDRTSWARSRVSSGTLKRQRLKRNRKRRMTMRSLSRVWGIFYNLPNRVYYLILGVQTPIIWYRGKNLTHLKKSIDWYLW